MSPRATPWLIAAFVAGCVLVGLPQWTPPYNRNGLDDPGMIAALGGLAAMTMMLVVGQVASPRCAWLVMAFCLPVAAAARVAVETAADRASHNFWPIELAVAVALGAFAVLPGVLLGTFTRRMQTRGRG